MPATENFRRNLATALKAKAWSQSQLAEAAGMVQPYVNRVLRGVTNPALEQAERLAKALGYPLSAMLGNAEDFADSVLTAITK